MVYADIQLHIGLRKQIFLLFRVVEVHRTGEATATPVKEGACLSE